MNLHTPHHIIFKKTQYVLADKGEDERLLESSVFPGEGSG